MGPSGPALYIMVGGFLGSGKSTAILALAQRLKRRSKRVGLITNDQSVGLVDTALMRSAGFGVEEIPGGCFCCRFDSLLEAAGRLEASSEAPEIFLAEPVGSCTDLVATVSYPLRRIYADRFAIAPMSVLVDPIRAARILGLEAGRSFSEKVIYIYRKQLEEADLILINKVDMIREGLLLRLRSALTREFPQAKVLAISARTGAGIEPWLETLLTQRLGQRKAMELDYDAYAEGEARLGWLNATLDLACPEPFDGETLMMDLAEAIRRDFQAADAEIAHLKMTLLNPHQVRQAAVVNLVRNDWVPQMSQSLPERIRQGRLVVNLRAEADPALLEGALQRGLAHIRSNHAKITLTQEHLECFKPSRPVPTWRISDPAAPIAP